MRNKKTSAITILATSDLHGYLDGIEKACVDNKVDILVIAGDIQPADIFTNPNRWFLDTFVGLLKNLKALNVEVVAIEGNHDFWLKNNRASIALFPDNFHLIYNESIGVKGISFYGTPWVPYINGRWCYEGKDADNYYRMIPANVDVLITHSPPRIPYHHIDESTAWDKRYWKHFGSEVLYKTILEQKPKVNFCGHIHSGDHKGCTIKGKGDALGCLCHNVSRVDERYRIAYPFRIVKFANGKIIESTTSNADF